MKIVDSIVLMLCCFAAIESAFAKPYDVAMAYCGTGSVREATVSYGRFRSLGGYLGAGGAKTQCFVEEPLPDKATVEWTKSNGESVSREVDVASILKQMSRSERRNIETFLVTITSDDRAVPRIVLDGTLDERVFKVKMYPDALNPQYANYVSLVQSCQKGDLDRVKSLVEAGTPMEWPDLDGADPLVSSVSLNQADIAKYLLAKIGKNISQYEIERCLDRSAMAGNVELFEIFLGMLPGGKINDELLISVLTTASKCNQKAIIDHLGKKRVNLNMRTSEVGHTPVMTAVQSGSQDALRALLEQGADPNPVVGGRSAFEWAREAEMQELLKKYGGCAPLRGHAKLVEYRKKKKEGSARKLIHNLGDRVKENTYAAPGNLFTLKIPPLSGEDVTISETEVNPGITFDARFVDDFGQALIVVCTKIRPELPQDDRVLDHVAKKYKQASSPDEMDAYTWQTNKLGRMISIVLKNQEYDEFFPYGVTMVDKNAEIESLAIDRFISFNGYLCEFAMIIPKPQDKASADFKVYAISCMDRVMADFSPAASKSKISKD